VYIALAILGAIYLAGWPIRIAFMRKHAMRAGAFPVLIPGFGGAVLLFADIMVLVRFGVDWAYFPLLLHGLLFAYGLVMAIRYLREKSVK